MKELKESGGTERKQMWVEGWGGGGEVREGGAEKKKGWRKKQGRDGEGLGWEEDVLQTEGEDTEERMCHSN